MTDLQRRSRDDALVLGPGTGRRIIFSLVGFFLVWTIPYGISRATTSPAAVAASQETSVMPTWLEWVITVLLALLGVFAIVSSWRSKTWVADDWISHRTLLRRRTLRRDEATGVRIKGKGTLSAMRQLDVHIDRHTGDRRYSIFMTSAFTPMQPVLDTLREWALRRPSLVADSETAKWLSVAPPRQS